MANLVQKSKPSTVLSFHWSAPGVRGESRGLGHAAGGGLTGVPCTGGVQVCHFKLGDMIRKLKSTEWLKTANKLQSSARSMKETNNPIDV
eukprot:825964-Prorocentrum_minimum.AAC.1